MIITTECRIDGQRSEDDEYQMVVNTRHPSHSWPVEKGKERLFLPFPHSAFLPFMYWVTYGCPLASTEVKGIHIDSHYE